MPAVLAARMVLPAAAAVVVVAAVTLLGSLPSAPARAADDTVAPPVPERPVITITGEVLPSVDFPTCLVLTDHDVRYLLLGGDPSVVKPFSRVTVTGRPDEQALTSCMGGTPLQVQSAEVS